MVEEAEPEAVGSASRGTGEHLPRDEAEQATDADAAASVTTVERAVAEAVAPRVPLQLGRPLGRRSPVGCCHAPVLWARSRRRGVSTTSSPLRQPFPSPTPLRHHSFTGLRPTPRGSRADPAPDELQEKSEEDLQQGYDNARPGPLSSIAAIRDRRGHDPRGRAVGARRRERGSLSGAGSSFVFPLVSQWIPTIKLAYGINVTYGPIGSGGGIAAVTNRTVDFGASDAPLTPDQLLAACNGCVQRCRGRSARPRSRTTSRG